MEQKNPHIWNKATISVANKLTELLLQSDAGDKQTFRNLLPPKSSHRRFKEFAINICGIREENLIIIDPDNLLKEN